MVSFKLYREVILSKPDHYTMAVVRQLNEHSAGDMFVQGELSVQFTIMVYTR